MPKRLFISQPMKDKTNEQIEKEREDAIKRVKEKYGVDIKVIDSFFKESFAAILEELKGQGITIVMVSHDVEFCARYADLVSMFFDGQILTTDTPRRFFGANSFYTTAANRMSRHVFENAVTAEDVISLCRQNRGDAL